MKWVKITIDTTCEAVDMLSYSLSELGVCGIEVEDKVPLSESDKKAMFIDILPELPEDDGMAKVSCYVEQDVDLDTLVADISVALSEIEDFLPVGSKKITIGETEDKDWINNWKQFFKPFRLEENIVIKPTWETLEDQKEDDIVIEIDPGTAFGTGSHQTTKLCIGQLKKYIAEHEAVTVFDAGCGSGILSIIALKLGAKSVFGVDIDPLAVEASYENIEVNGITKEQAAFLKVNILEDTAFAKNHGKKYDAVVANILADVIIPLSGVVGAFLKEDGVFISSGIINTKEQEVKEALLSNHFQILETNYMGDWVSFTAKKEK